MIQIMMPWYDGNIGYCFFDLVRTSCVCFFFAFFLPKASLFVFDFMSMVYFLSFVSSHTSATDCLEDLSPK